MVRVEIVDDRPMEALVALFAGGPRLADLDDFARSDEDYGSAVVGERHCVLSTPAEGAPREVLEAFAFDGRLDVVYLQALVGDGEGEPWLSRAVGLMGGHAPIPGVDDRLFHDRIAAVADFLVDEDGRVRDVVRRGVGQALAVFVPKRPSTIPRSWSESSSLSRLESPLYSPGIVASSSVGSELADIGGDGNDDEEEEEEEGGNAADLAMELAAAQLLINRQQAEISRLREMLAASVSDAAFVLG